MNTEIDPRIEQEIDKLYNHEIKAKRVKKEILNLNDLHLENIVIEHVRFSSIGIRIPVTFQKKGKHWHFEVRIDREYPFGHPQLHSLDKQSNLISEARDLLSLVLSQGQNWGPSIMLSRFIQDIPLLVSKIEAAPGTLLGRYWQGEEYDIEELKDKGLSVFKLTENTWKYLLKHSTQKVFAVGANAILKLQQLQQSTPNRLRLQTSILLKDIKEFISNPATRELTIKYLHDQKEQPMYLVAADTINMDGLLEHVNPVQMVERRVKTTEGKKEVNEQLIKDYGFLIDFYSARDEAVSDEYLSKMREAIKRSHEADSATGKAQGVVAGK